MVSQVSSIVPHHDGTTSRRSLLALLHDLRQGDSALVVVIIEVEVDRLAR